MNKLKDLLNSESKIIILIFGINLILRLIYFSLFFETDLANQLLPGGLDKIALTFINGRQFYYPTVWSSFHIILSLVYLPLKFFGLLDYRLMAIAIINILFTSVSAVLIYKISNYLFPRHTLPVYIITGLFSVYYPLYYFNLLTIPESIFTFILIFLYHTLIKYPFNNQTAVLIGAAVAIGLIMKPIMLLLGIFIVLWLILTNLRVDKSFLKHLIIAGCCFFLIYFMAASLNYRFDLHHNFVVAGNGGINITMAWCEPKRITYRLKDGETRWYAPPVFQNRSDLPKLTYDVPFYNQNYYYRMGLNCLIHNPVKLLSNMKHVFNIFYSIFYPDVLENVFHSITIQIWRLMAVPLIIGFTAFPLMSKHKRKEWLLGFVFIMSLIISVYISNPGEERYLIPYYFIFIIFGGWSICEAVR